MLLDALYGIPEKLFIIPRESSGGEPKFTSSGEGEGREVCSSQQTTQCAFVFVMYDIRHAEAAEGGLGSSGRRTLKDKMQVAIVRCSLEYDMSCSK